MVNSYIYIYIMYHKFSPNLNINTSKSEASYFQLPYVGKLSNQVRGETFIFQKNTINIFKDFKQFFIKHQSSFYSLQN